MGSQQDQFYLDLGRHLRLTREARNLTQAQLAERVGKGRSTILSVEAGSARVPVDLFVQITRILGQEPADVLRSFLSTHVPTDSIDLLDGIGGRTREALLQALELRSDGEITR